MAGELGPAGPLCANCQAPLSGEFCSSCGQRHEPHVHSVKEFASEAFESVTHADSRVWRTLWLLVSKPGFLTREFFEGRRARYLPPFRLYLVLSVILFLVVAAVSHQTAVVELEAPEGAGATDLTNLQVVPKNPAETPAQRAKRICDGGNIGIVSEAMQKRLLLSCRKVVIDDGRAFAQAMVHNIPRALFVLLPLLALVMRLMYLRRYYVEHLLFFVHNHAFTFLLFTAFLLAAAVTSWTWLLTLEVLVILFYPPIYTYKAMRRVYAQGRWLTRLKFFFLTVAYLTLLMLLAFFTAVFSLVTL